MVLWDVDITFLIVAQETLLMSERIKNIARFNDESVESNKANCRNYNCGDCVVHNEFAKEMITNINDCRNINIDCSALDCVYNHKRECHVDHVQIEESGTRTTCAKCSTYKKRDFKY